MQPGSGVAPWLLSLRSHEASGHIACHGDELTQAASQHEQVPDAMAVSDALVVDEKVDARAVDQAAGDEPRRASGRQRRYEWMDGHEREPAHQHVKHHRYAAGSAPEREFL